MLRIDADDRWLAVVDAALAAPAAEGNTFAALRRAACDAAVVDTFPRWNISRLLICSLERPSISIWGRGVFTAPYIRKLSLGFALLRILKKDDYYVSYVYCIKVMLIDGLILIEYWSKSKMLNSSLYVSFTVHY